MAADRFVVQEHQATSHHYDFRLQMGSVMTSWAVPKGPSLDPKDKHLAVKVEDHPLEYQRFEGNVPEGEYGAGTVIVWDAGTYRNITEHAGKPVPIERGLRDGHIAVWLKGKKLKGGFALTRIRAGKQDSWLLVKMQDDEAVAGRPAARLDPRSVKTGRTLAEVARARTRARATPRMIPGRAGSRRGAYK